MKEKARDKEKKKKNKQRSSVKIEFKGNREMVTVLYNYPGIGALTLTEGDNDVEALAKRRKLKLKGPKFEIPKEKNGEKKKVKKPKDQGLMPMGEGFKVLLTVSEGFSLKGTKVNVFSEDVLIGQGLLNNNGAIVFPHIKVPLEKALRVIVRFPKEQYLEDLDFFVDAGDTALVAQI